MKKLVGFLAGLCACCLILGGLTLSREHNTANAATVENEIVEVAETSAATQLATSLLVHLEWTDDNFAAFVRDCVFYGEEKGILFRSVSDRISLA